MTKTYPILYSRDSKGKVRMWFMEQDGDKFRTTSGLEDGQKITTKFTTCEGKNIGKANETSPEEQAEKEILAEYKKQKELNYFESIKDIDNQSYFSPMLAQSFEKRKDKIDWSKGNYVSPKMDGLRAVITKTGAKSRNGKLFLSFPHILRELKVVFKDFPNLITDGEIYTDKLKNDFNKIISLAKKSKPEDEDFVESEKYLEYWIFDCPTLPGGFHERYTQLVDLFDKYFKDNKWIKLCKHDYVKTEAELETYLHRYIEAGFEGLMLNTYDGNYEEKRSNNLVKYKLFMDCEAEIIDIVEGLGNRSDMFGYAKLKLDNGNLFDANARGNEESYREILKNKKDYIGKRATIRYQNLTPDGIPRFPVIIDWNRFD